MRTQRQGKWGSNGSWEESAWESRGLRSQKGPNQKGHNLGLCIRDVQDEIFYNIKKQIELKSNSYLLKFVCSSKKQKANKKPNAIELKLLVLLN